VSRQNKNIEFEEPKEESVKQFSFRSLIDGNVLTQKAVLKQAPFIVLLVLISFISIANRNHAEKLVIKSSHLQNEVKELRSQAISTSSELMKFSRQTTVNRIVHERGLELEENLEPPKKLIIEPRRSRAHEPAASGE
jgi:hypothetical protein